MPKLTITAKKSPRIQLLMGELHHRPATPSIPTTEIGNVADLISTDAHNDLKLGSDDKLLVEPQQQEMLNSAVRTDIFQNLTPDEQKQACQNIGIGEPDIDFVAIYNAAKGA